MSHPFQFRPGTHDEMIFQSVVTYNEYQLPDQFPTDSIVVDIGTHIGSFSYVALERGAAKVYAFEAEPSNWEAARRNLASYGDRVVVAKQAVWRSDRPALRLGFFASTDCANTGGGGVLGEAATGQPGIDAVPLDSILDQITDHGRRRVNLLKIDCEGSEFPILFTAQRLGWIDRIVGEFHELASAHSTHAIPEVAKVPGQPSHSIEALAKVLETHGFTVTFIRGNEPNLGLFFADNQKVRRADQPHALGHRLAAAWARLSGRAKTPTPSRT